MDRTVVVDTTGSPHAALRPVPVGAVRMGDGFWRPRMEANRKTAIPRLLQLLEEHGVVDNFRRLHGKAVERRGLLFTDSDLYKWMEAAAWVLASEPDAAIQEALEDVIDAVLPAQGADGYLNTWFVDERAGQRFTRLSSDHELYCAGHLFQAAVAHHRATGETRLLDAARRLADYFCERFGPGGIKEADGHPEIELALVELYRETGERRYLELAGFFLRQQGLADLQTLEGHAVRAGYSCCGGADYVAETGDAAFRDALERQWQSLVTTKLYVTGGMGGRYTGESLGAPYELPNERAYSETCAALANVFWNWRMLLLTGEARFADLMERALYNGFLSGVSLGGAEYFYVNPLACNGQAEGDPWYAWARRGSAQRNAWHGCTCCPPNVDRMLASLPGYLFSTGHDGIWVHLYDNATLRWRLDDGTPFTLSMETRYPWEERVVIELSPERPVTTSLFLRIPEWCRSARISTSDQRPTTHDNEFRPTTNDQRPTTNDRNLTPGSYTEIRREWRAGDRVVLALEMPATLIECDPRVAENRGSVALQRGPLVYCLEAPDNPGIDVYEARVIAGADGAPVDVADEHRVDLLGGVTTLSLAAATPLQAAGPRPLYAPLGAVPPETLRDGRVTAIPYYAWANRGPARMTVWMRRA
jgi:DUF1680 family protein